jgi:hypothetical protein
VFVTGRERRRAHDDDTRERGNAQSRYRVLTDRALLDALRSRDGEAIEEFIRRYQPLVLVQARRLRIPPEDRTHWAIELLYHVANALARDAASIPRSLGPYLVTACKRKAFDEWRNQRTRERWEVQCADEAGAPSQRTIAGTCSEDAVRSTYGPDWEPVRLPPVLERLVSIFEEGISTEEQQLLSWVGQRVPYSLVAEWLGISRAAAIKRVTRLRDRLIEAALRFGSSLDAADVSELTRFLRRAGVVDEARLLEMHNQIQARQGPR